MQDITTESRAFNAALCRSRPSVSPAAHDPLTDVLRRGVPDLLIQAVEAESTDARVEY